MKLCPKCELNYINDDQDSCSICKNDKTVTKNKSVSTGLYAVDFSKLVTGVVYGTNSRKIYEKFCDTLGWDKSKISRFGWQTPLYATFADETRTLDVWFVSYPNYDAKNANNYVKDGHVITAIIDKGDKILEVVDDRVGSSNVADRITFVKTTNGYQFLGVYKIVKNGTSRAYERISKEFPLK